jgi:Holliday junction resolvase
MRRNRAPGAGNARELKVMAVLAEEGWLCASRRHIGGAGDVLAIRYALNVSSDGISATVIGVEAMLLEVKSTAGGPWERFGPDDRRDLIETAERHGAEPWLYWWPPRRELQRIHSSEFPPNRQPEIEVDDLPGHGTTELQGPDTDPEWIQEDLRRNAP